MYNDGDYKDYLVCIANDLCDLFYDSAYNEFNSAKNILCKKGKDCENTYYNDL